MAPSDKVRVRFAPSPTGQLHVGNARTALFNWLFARQKKGVMALRVEDTDVERSEARYEDQLLDDLKWLGLDWDEGPDVGGPFPPYRQSDRLAIYREHAERLLDEGKAYLCFCTEEELQRDRDRAMAEGGQPIYPGTCRRLDPAEARRRRSAGEPCAIRLRIPEHPIRFHDIVRGAVEFPNEAISDPIILRSSGMPVYNYVVVIDDALMKITHVIRGDDHLSNTPKQVALYEALGWPVPEFAHLSTILGADRTRLSKRHGATSIANFRDMGVLPEALFNYLALLGWAPTGGTREIFSRDELVKEFDLARVTPASAMFDMEKLYWLNRHYVKQRMANEQGRKSIVEQGAMCLLRSELFGKVQADEISGSSGAGYEWLTTLIELLVPYVNTLSELPDRAAFIFNYDPKAALGSPENAEVFAWPRTSDVINALAQKVRQEPDGFTPERFNQVVKEIQAEAGVKGKELFHPVRVVITGAPSGPAFDKVIPIIEQGSRLNLPRHVLSVRERVEAFLAARG